MYCLINFGFDPIFILYYVKILSYNSEQYLLLSLAPIGTTIENTIVVWQKFPPTPIKYYTGASLLRQTSFPFLRFSFVIDFAGGRFKKMESAFLGEIWKRQKWWLWLWLFSLVNNIWLCYFIEFMKIESTYRNYIVVLTHGVISFPKYWRIFHILAFAVFVMRYWKNRL